MRRVVVARCGMFVDIDLYAKRLDTSDRTLKLRSFKLFFNRSLIYPTLLYACALLPPPSPRRGVAHRICCSGRNLVSFFLLIAAVD